MRMLIPSALILQIVIATGCGESPSALEAQRALDPPRPAISDAAHGGREGFYFLPPLVPEPEFDGVFDALRQPVVQICELSGDACPVLAEYTLLSGPDSVTVQIEPLAEHYSVAWHTDRFTLTDGATYRIRVLLEGRIMGYVDIVRVGTDLESTATGEVIPLENGTTLPIRFRLEAELRLGAVVPLQAPNSVPEGFYDESNRMHESPCISGEYLKDIVVVRFRPEATQLQRQQAVDQVNGEVVGGIRSTTLEGSYYVQLPTDDTGQNVCDAKYYLRTLPYVGYAIHSSFSSGDLYRRANDEGDWVKILWQVNPDSLPLITQRWGHEIVAAPLAWGCEIGSDSTAVAVVDQGFWGVTDLEENIDPEWRGGLGANAATDHGTKVASIVAARGNNGFSMTGMMWRADLRPYEIGPFVEAEEVPGATAERVMKAIEDGATVVNLSRGANWHRDVGHPPNPSNPDDVDYANDRYLALLDALRSFSSGALPLLVIGAGNDAVDAKWSGYTQVANDFSEHVIVVGMITSAGDLADSSNHGTLVDIAAPGHGVFTMNGGGIIVSGSGTSAAAAYVSGVAGLLKSFDPRLTTVDLWDLILEGAERGGRSAGQYDVVNAYESLRAAAERSGAPLCGNDVWASGGQLYTRRAGGTVDVLASTAGTPVGQVEVLHGGKLIRYLTPPNTSHVLRWDAGTWVPGTMPADSADLRGGTHASVFGESHDRDSLAFIDDSVISETRWYETRDMEEAPVLVQWLPGSPQEVGRITVNDLPGPVQVTCLERHPDTGTCFFSVIESRGWLFRLGYPQFPSGGRQAYITVSPLHHVEIDSTPWTQCTFDASHECRAVLTLQNQPEALVYRMDLAQANGAPVPVETIPDESVYWIGHSENGTGVVLGRGRWRITFWADAAHYYQTGSPFYDFSSQVETCVIEYRREADFEPIPGQEVIAAEDACNFGTFDRPSTGAGGGTIAPNLIPVSAAPRASTTMGGSTSVGMPILDPTGQEVRASDP
ncbi:MAG: S8 family peptidase [Gemmatimonadota bacterium]